MQIKVAVVGTGGISRQHGKALAENPGAKIVAGIDVDGRKRAEFCSTWGGKPLDSLEPVLDTVDAVYVLTPPGFRKQYALQAIHAGKHVFCEKPLAATVDDGKAIADAAEQRGVFVMTGFNMRFRTGYKRLFETVRKGALGDIHHFWCYRYGEGAGARGRVATDNWRTNPETLTGMTVESLSHDIDLIRWILDDDVVSVSASTFSTVANLDGFDNNAHVLMKLGSGKSAVIDASWSSRIELIAVVFWGLAERHSSRVQPSGTTASGAAGSSTARPTTTNTRTWKCFKMIWTSNRISSRPITS